MLVVQLLEMGFLHSLVVERAPNWMILPLWDIRLVVGLDQIQELACLGKAADMVVLPKISDLEKHPEVNEVCHVGCNIPTEIDRPFVVPRMPFLLHHANFSSVV